MHSTKAETISSFIRTVRLDPTNVRGLKPKGFVINARLHGTDSATVVVRIKHSFSEPRIAYHAFYEFPLALHIVAYIFGQLWNCGACNIRAESDGCKQLLTNRRWNEFVSESLANIARDSRLFLNVITDLVAEAEGDVLSKIGDARIVASARSN